MKKLIKNIFASFGFTLVKTKFLRKNDNQQVINLDSNASKNELIGNVFDIIKNGGFAPNHIMDIGANHGTWTREVLKCFDSANYTLIEPQNDLSQSFSDLLSLENFDYLPIGVGSTPGHFNFTIVDRDDSCNFRISEEEAKEKGYSQTRIEVDTIDNIVSKSRFGIPDLLKIDAEGLDLEVLEGASSILGKTEVILVEATVLNKDFRNDVRTMLNFMHEKGYKLFDITDLNRPFNPKVLWLVELMFIKENGFLDKKNWVN